MREREQLLGRKSELEIHKPFIFQTHSHIENSR